MTVGSGSGRRLPNWISSFIRFTDGLSSPRIFRQWAAISLLSSVLERKVWVQAQGQLFPNLYVVLVGTPGVGKSVIISLSERMLRKVPDIFVAPSSVTSASLIDTMQLAQRKILRPVFQQWNSAQIISSEFQNFLPAYEASFMGIMTKLYDGELYEERRRTGKQQHVKIDYPLLGLLAGTTPSYLNDTLPVGAWDQGFTSRTVFVYSEAGDPRYLFEDAGDAQYNSQLEADLVIDLQSVANLVGQCLWTPEAKSEITKWHLGGCKPVPGHGRLAHYNSRRVLQVLKLGTIAAIARDNSMSVTTEDYETGKAWLLEAESHMPDIFKNMSQTPEARAMEDARFYMTQLNGATRGPVPEHFLINFLKDRVPSHSINKVIEVMVRSKQMEAVVVNGVVHYKPKPNAP